MASRLLRVARVDEDVSIISLDFAQTRPQRRESTIEDKATFLPPRFFEKDEFEEEEGLVRVFRNVLDVFLPFEDRARGRLNHR